MRDAKLFETEYGYWFNLANERFYRTIDTVLNLIQLVGGSAAALGVVQQNPAFIVGSGLALAVCAALSLLIQPAVKAERHAACKSAWRTLRGDEPTLSDIELTQRVTQLQASGPAGISALADPSYNATAQALGRTDAAIKLSFAQGFAKSLA